MWQLAEFTAEHHAREWNTKPCSPSGHQQPMEADMQSDGEKARMKE
jgi:hypothetical protein